MAGHHAESVVVVHDSDSDGRDDKPTNSEPILPVDMEKRRLQKRSKAIAVLAFPLKVVHSVFPTRPFNHLSCWCNVL